MSDQRVDFDQRPSPEALLEAARREEARIGKLRIFVGAAPGVGKTFTMLETAGARRKDGYDIIIGVVETHGRKETEALLQGLEVIPRRRIDYRGRSLEEMDLDAIIARRPQIVLVDELAHTNAPGSRHPKRYLDVEELLQHGIDVYTTVNIQHIESLNDVVAQITHVRVRETVPDAVFDRADSVELVDLTPDDLIQRLKEGKVYVPQQASRALAHFFSPANLIALRELALRRTAERVDEQLLTEMQARAIPGPIAAGERILVCVSEDPRSAGLVRYAKRLADRLHGPLTALYVETRRSLQLTEEERDRIADTLRLAQALKAEPVTVPGAGRSIADDVLTYARANNITQLVVGKTTRTRWFEILYGSVVHDLVRTAGNISVHVIAGEEIAREPIPRKTVRAASRAPALDPRPYAGSIAVVAAAAAIGMLLQPWIGVENIDLVFLTGIVGIAVRYGLLPSLAASVLSALAYNFFFTEPFHTFLISNPRDVVAVGFFTIVAIVVSNVAARARVHAIVAMSRARTTESLYTFSRKLAGAGTLDDVLWATAYQTAAMLKVRVVLLLPEDGSVAVKAGYPPEDILDEADLAAAKWAWQNDHAAGRGSDTLPGAKRLFLPMRTGRGTIGVVGLDKEKPGPLFTPDERRLLDALVDQGALAIERVNLVEEMGTITRTAEADRLRSALLTSISHDLRTPLAAVLGAAGALKDLSTKLSDNQKADLLSTIIDELERLNRFIANLLDMTKLESRRDQTERRTTRPARNYRHGTCGGPTRSSPGIASNWTSPGSLPMLNLDPVLFEQVLFNLLDNASKYSPDGANITIRGWREGNTVVLQIIDEGRGIAAGDVEHIFDKFYRTHKGDHVRAGTGLGLAICRGFVEAMNGTITASSRADRPGAVFTITLPLLSEPSRVVTAA